MVCTYSVLNVHQTITQIVGLQSLHSRYIPFMMASASSSKPIVKYNYGDVNTHFDDNTKMMNVQWKMYPFQLGQFLQSPAGSVYVSGIFTSEMDTEWQMVVYPNGWNESNAGCCILYLYLRSMPESYSKMMVYYNMRCNETGASDQCMTIYDKPTGKGFPARTQLLSELSDLKKLSFSCNFRILRIEYKNGEPNYEYPLEMTSIPKKERFIWNVDEELTRKMAMATVGKRFEADGILSSSGLFSILMEPNKCSGDTESEGKIKVYLQLCTLPIGASGLKVKYKILAPELGEVRSFTKTLNYDHQSWGGEMGQFQYLDAIQSMKIVAETEILEVFDANGDRKKGIQFRSIGTFRSAQ